MTADYAQAYRPMALEDDPGDKAVGSDGQALSIARWVEVAHCRAHAHTAGDVECQGAYARGVRSIMVRAVGEPGVSACPIEGALLGAPIHRADTCDKLMGPSEPWNSSEKSWSASNFRR